MLVSLRKLKKIIVLISVNILVLHLIEVGGDCDEFYWACDNGQCIPEDSRCDGLINCSDGSDEIAENCIQGYRSCYAYAFRCSYGACIKGGSQCNGRQECADNSDEIACSSNRQQQLQGHCGADEMQCSNQECISISSKCDGRKDCANGFDETLEVCAGIICPDVGFHCGYGGCINGNAKCNGSKECADGSDEAWELCGYPRHSLSPQRPPPSSVIDPSLGRYKCQIPENKSYMTVKLHPLNNTIAVGSWVDDYETVHIQCAAGYRLVGHADNFCRNGNWNTKFPSCSRFCSAKGLSIIQFCDNLIACKKVLPNSEVRIACAPGYSKASNDFQTLRCQSNGQFNRQPETCHMNCGIRISNDIQLAKGVTVEQSAAPWHVSIYEMSDSRLFEYKCAGSIVSPSIIITAAHCFLIYGSVIAQDYNRYKVVAGNQRREYSEQNDNNIQIRDIETVVIDRSFNIYNLTQDIAIVKLLKPLEFKINILAICLSTESTNAAEQYIPDNWMGWVVGWETTDGPSNNLQQVQMKTHSYYQCRQHLSNLTEDKFCLESQPGSTVCRGDSGGGFVRYNQYTRRFDLLGVISFAVSITSDCARNGFITATNINYMKTHMKNKLQEFQNTDRLMF